MIELVVFGAFFGFFWVAVAYWARHLDGFFTLAAFLPNKADVADLENQLPHIPGDPHFVITASDIEYLEAVARYRESHQDDEESA